MASGNIAIKYGLKGPNLSIYLLALLQDTQHRLFCSIIYYGDADVMVAGGAEAAISLGMAGFNAAKALSTRNDSPEEAKVVLGIKEEMDLFSEKAQVFGEELEAAGRDQQKSMLRLLVGQSDDAYHIAAPAEDGIGAKLAMTNALKDSQLDISDIEHINAHGTSTPLEDVVESMAIKDVFKMSTTQFQLVLQNLRHGHC